MVADVGVWSESKHRRLLDGERRKGLRGNHRVHAAVNPMQTPSLESTLDTTPPHAQSLELVSGDQAPLTCGDRRNLPSGPEVAMHNLPRDARKMAVGWFYIWVM